MRAGGTCGGGTRARAGPASEPKPGKRAAGLGSIPAANDIVYCVLMATVYGVGWLLSSALGCGGPCGGPLQDIAGAVTSQAGVQPKPSETLPTSSQVAAATGRLSCYTVITVLSENLEPASAAARPHPEAVGPLCLSRSVGPLEQGKCPPAWRRHWPYGMNHPTGAICWLSRRLSVAEPCLYSRD